MKDGNWTSVTEFILLGLSEDPELQLPLFVLFFLIYIITVVCNLSVIILIWISPNLHTPMYLLLSNLSFVDICCSSVITPKMLGTFMLKNTISFRGCMAQLFFFAYMVSGEVFLLTALSYDRYVAICNPLRYTTIMTKQACTFIVVFISLISFLDPLIHTIGILRLSFCSSNEIMHFHCDVIPLLKLSCSDTSLNELIVTYESSCLTIASIVPIIISYTCIISTIIRIRSSDGRWRTFSTCSSHAASVTLYFGTIAVMYIMPSTINSLEQGRVAAVFYTVVIPMVNPMIYSLRNKDVKDSLRKAMQKIPLKGKKL
ncbi:olfactory receptor 8D1-like [Pleurodeles waltl]|uniref:olfactory receptor 8D1-like n=1 Tax=Pleurodeles waltl TaxID=8319 RepID=UPI003709AF77